jgi:hypothetical protein
MRSRNVYFNANGLRPFTKHYHYLDRSTSWYYSKTLWDFNAIRNF